MREIATANPKFVVALSAMLLASCAARPPLYLAVPRAASRSQEPVSLPLDPEGRRRLEAFLSHGGHPNAPDPVPDPSAAVHRSALDALESPASLRLDTTSSGARRFCDAAARLCGQTALFRGKPFVREVVDARESRRPFPAPLAVSDGGYWWIFQVKDGRLSEVLIVCSIDRNIQR